MENKIKIPDIEKLVNSGNTNLLGRLYIQKHYPDFYKYLLDKYKHIHWNRFSELLYLYHNNLEDRPKCKCCDKKVDYIDFTHGYRTYCSTKCQTNDPIIIEKCQKYKKERYGEHHELIINKTKQTKLERYGDPNYSNREKINQTKLERYGDPNYSNREKAEQTTLKRYGVKNAMQNKEIAKKSLQNKIEKYGVDNISNQIKIKQTCLERYGVENVSLIPETIKKIENTKLERYGDPNYSNREKAEQTTLKRYGVKNIGCLKESRIKAANTCLEKYGVENIMKLDEFKEKNIQTNIEKYGVEYYTQTDEYKKRVAEKHDEIQQKIYNTKKQNNSFNTSKIEEDFSKWLVENNINFIRQYSSVKYPFACDFYFPIKDLYLEIQGFWSHGGHPYDPFNPDDISMVNEWKDKNTEFYDNALYVWTTADPLKRETAKRNNLNWKEVFTNNLNELIDEVENIIL